MIKRFAAIIGILLMIFTALPVQAAAAGNGSASAVMQSGRAGTENKGLQAAARGTDIFRYLGNGWHKRDGSWFYVRNGKALTGWIRDGGKWYFLGRDGKMKTGWVKDGGKWYYLTSSGAMKTGWLGDQGKRYYLTSSGVMKTGWMKISGKWYYFTRSGAMKTGWLKDKGKWYYLLSGGAMKKGWLKIGGKTYYLTSGGTRKTGWLTLKGKKYYFDADGVLDAEKTEEADKAGAAKDTSSASSAVNEIKETGNKAETENTAQSTGEKKTNAGSRARTKGELVAQYALQFVGNPYVYGGNSLTKGTDCSGFVMLIYRHFGVSLPHYDAAIRTKGKSVASLREAKAGDIICYYGHVAIYLGDGRIVHASNSRDGIKISERADYRTIAGIRRIFD